VPLRTQAAGAALALLVLAAAPAAADPPAEARPNKPNSLTIGVGGAYLPSYEGSDDYSFSPIALAFGKVGGIGFATRGTALYVDLIPSDPNRPFSFDLGPVGNLRLDRSRRIRDPQVSALGKIGPAIELGGYAGITKNRVLHRYDTLGVRVAVTRDVTDTHSSTGVTPSIDYMSPLSTTTAVNLSASADHVGNGFARTYYSVSPAGALASHLPVYSAHGGWKSYRLSLVLGHVLTGDLRNPHLSAFAAFSYSRVLGNFARSPVVALVGNPNQYVAAGGLAYSF
jgi:outer membrane scaffolding protein for murein synthesis (MipA/OmpV family)